MVAACHATVVGICWRSDERPFSMAGVTRRTDFFFCLSRQGVVRHTPLGWLHRGFGGIFYFVLLLGDLHNTGFAILVCLGVVGVPWLFGQLYKLPIYTWGKRRGCWTISCASLDVGSDEVLGSCVRAAFVRKIICGGRVFGSVYYRLGLCL